MLVINECIVTIDAMGCQKEIASKITEREAHYILAVKGNQGGLKEQVEESFRFLAVDSFDEQLDSGHGRVETRKCTVVSGLSMIEQGNDWAALQCLVY